MALSQKPHTENSTTTTTKPLARKTIGLKCKILIINNLLQIIDYQQVTDAGDFSQNSFCKILITR